LETGYSKMLKCGFCHNASFNVLFMVGLTFKC
jgi:hypothetical protein